MPERTVIVPDTNRIGFYDFSSVRPGSLPDGWTGTGKAEAVTVNGQSGRWLQITSPGVFLTGLRQQYPEEFIFEFDLYHGIPISGGGLTVGLAELAKDEKPELFWNSKNRIFLELNFANTGSKTGFSRTLSRKNSKNEMANQVYTDLLSDKNNPVHISVLRKGETIRVFINQEKVWDLPQALAADSRLNAILFYSRYAEEKVKLYLGNVSLIKGAPLDYSGKSPIVPDSTKNAITSTGDKKLPGKIVAPDLNPKGNDVVIDNIDLPSDSTIRVIRPIGPKQIFDSLKKDPAALYRNMRLCIDKDRNVPLPARAEIVTPTRLPKIKPDGSLDTTWGSIQQGLTALTKEMWNPGDLISVAFYPNETTQFVIDKVKEYASIWERVANIRFWYVPNIQGAQIKIGFDAEDGSWSWIGRSVLNNAEGAKTMNFGWFTDTTEEEELRRTILHEFGHALGFVHEHQAPGSGIQWDKEEVYSYFGKSPINWSRSKVDEQIFAKYEKTHTNSSVYDSRSIMHYFFPAELTKDGFSFSQNTSLSTADSAFVRQVYPFPFDPANASGILKTGDDCDEIEFSVEYKASGVGTSEIEFVLESGANASGQWVTWWKRIGIPLKGGGESGLEIQNKTVAVRKLNRTLIDETRPITFWKAKFLGVHTLLNYTWPVFPALIGGCRVRLVWRRDSCL